MLRASASRSEGVENGFAFNMMGVRRIGNRSINAKYELRGLDSVQRPQRDRSLIPTLTLMHWFLRI